MVPRSRLCFRLLSSKSKSSAGPASCISIPNPKRAVAKKNKLGSCGISHTGHMHSVSATNLSKTPPKPSSSPSAGRAVSHTPSVRFGTLGRWVYGCKGQITTYHPSARQQPRRFNRDSWICFCNSSGASASFFTDNNCWLPSTSSEQVHCFDFKVFRCCMASATDRLQLLQDLGPGASKYGEVQSEGPSGHHMRHADPQKKSK